MGISKRAFVPLMGVALLGLIWVGLGGYPRRLHSPRERPRAPRPREVLKAPAPERVVRAFNVHNLVFLLGQLSARAEQDPYGRALEPPPRRYRS